MVTLGSTKWDSLERTVYAVFILSAAAGNTYAVTCVYTEVGLVPSSERGNTIHLRDRCSNQKRQKGKKGQQQNKKQIKLRNLMQLN